uniref:Protein SMG9 n=1 Tax=Parascaris univalens TaxID=6257 RepID=A0A915AIU0_PARUN
MGRNPILNRGALQRSYTALCSQEEDIICAPPIEENLVSGRWSCSVVMYERFKLCSNIRIVCCCEGFCLYMNGR